MGFIEDGTAVLPVVKSDLRTPTGAVTEAKAADLNQLRQAAIDLRGRDILEYQDRVANDAAIIASGVTPANVNTAPVIATGSSTARTIANRFADTVNVRDYGAVGNGVADDTSAVQAALSAAGSGGTVFFPAGTYKITSKLTTVANTVLRGAGRYATTLSKAYNGYILNLAQWCKVQDLGFNGNRSSFTGGGVEITLGSNTVTVSDQGQQLIQDCFFTGVSGYAVDYTVANKGWHSRVVGCRFWDTAADAAVSWPDEAALGGNRYVSECDSDGPLVNARGCDNGHVVGNICGGTAASNQAVVMPAGTANRAKKLFIVGNRFAIANGTVNVRGTDSVFADNIVAGAVSLESNGGGDGASNWHVHSNVTVLGLTENNYSAQNVVYDAAYIKPRLFSATQVGLTLFGSSGSFIDNSTGDMYLRCTTNGNLWLGDLAGSEVAVSFQNHRMTFQNVNSEIRFQGAYVRAGSGTPEGAVTAPVGSLYLRTNGGAGTSLYVKESGSGNTGWIPK